MGKRLLLGILKGLFIGAAIGALLHFALGAHTITEWTNYPLYAGVGAVAGGLSGRAPWKPGAWIAGVLKAIFGVVVGVGLYALGQRVLPGIPMALPDVASGTPMAHVPLLFAPMVATIYATFVELDDGGDQPEEAPASGVRAGKIALEDIDVGEDEEAAKPAAKTKKN